MHLAQEPQVGLARSSRQEQHADPRCMMGTWSQQWRCGSHQGCAGTAARGTAGGTSSWPERSICSKADGPAASHAPVSVTNSGICPAECPAGQPSCTCTSLCGVSSEPAPPHCTLAQSAFRNTIQAAPCRSAARQQKRMPPRLWMPQLMAAQMLGRATSEMGC